MRDRFKASNLLTARVLVWAGLSVLFLWYLRWGSEIISLTILLPHASLGPIHLGCVSLGASGNRQFDDARSRLLGSHRRFGRGSVGIVLARADSERERSRGTGRRAAGGMTSDRNWRARLRAGRTIDVAWLLVLAIVSLWVFHRLGGFDLWATVTRPDGSTERIVKTFGGVDHPFHATRADLLRRSLQDGQLLRWISAHQGGYPVEFYPLGGAGIRGCRLGVTAGRVADDGGAQDRHHCHLSASGGWFSVAVAAGQAAVGRRSAGVGFPPVGAGLVVVRRVYGVGRLGVGQQLSGDGRRVAVPAGRVSGHSGSVGAVGSICGDCRRVRASTPMCARFFRWRQSRLGRLCRSAGSRTGVQRFGARRHWP